MDNLYCFSYSDNHDIISMKLYDMDKIEDGEGKEQEDFTKIIPHAKNAAVYRG